MTAHGVPERIGQIRLRKVYDSRGNPTVEATVLSDVDRAAMASCPSGASTGSHEVVSFPDGSVDRGIEFAMTRVVPHLQGRLLGQQQPFDAELKDRDGTGNFASLGGNIASALSLAYARASAAAEGRELFDYVARLRGRRPGRPPAIVGNVMNGGVHAVGGPSIQEFIAFVEAPGFRTQVEAAVQVHREVGRRLRERFPSAALGRGDEGGWVAPTDDEQALEILAQSCQAVQASGRFPGATIRPGLDFAASELYRDGRYHYRGRSLTPEEQVAFVHGLVERFDLAYAEDPFDEEGFSEFAALTSRLPTGRKVHVVGDDLYTTSPGRVLRGIEGKATNSVLLKVNQVGTLSDTLETVALADQAGWSTITSHRSGETTDTWLSHLSIGFGSAGIKCGVLGGERIAKLNELLRIAGDASS